MTTRSRRPGVPRRAKRPRGGVLRDGLLVLAALTRGQSTVQELSEQTGLHLRTVYRVMRGWADVGLRLERENDGPRLVWHHVSEREVLSFLARLRTPR